MQFRLALFDQSTRDSRNRYWTWFHPELTVDLLSRLYDKIVSHNLPNRPQDLKPDEYVGGAVCIDGWLCCYRVGNGGLDQFGREGRFVPICAFARVGDTRGYNCLEVLESTQLKELAEKAQSSCPVPQPENLLIDVAVPAAQEATDAIQELRRGGRLRVDGGNAIAHAGSILAGLDPTLRFECRIEKFETGPAATLTMAPPSAHTTTVATNRPQQTAPGAPAISQGQESPLKEESSTSNSRAWPRVMSQIAIGIMCVLIGTLLGSHINSTGAKPAPATSEIGFSIREGGVRFMDKLEIPLELVPDRLYVDGWKLDGRVLPDRSDRIRIPVTEGRHKVEVQYHYINKEGLSQSGKALALINVDSSNPIGTRVEVRPQ